LAGEKFSGWAMLEGFAGICTEIGKNPCASITWRILGNLRKLVVPGRENREFLEILTAAQAGLNSGEA
jgi:hypothetical protein